MGQTRYAAWNKKVLSCFLNSPVSRVDIISTGSLFQSFGAAISKALLEETSLVLGTSSSCLPTERSDARVLYKLLLSIDCLNMPISSDGSKHSLSLNHVW